LPGLELTLFLLAAAVIYAGLAVVSVYSFKEKPICCTIYLQYISSHTSTGFWRIYSPSSGGTPYGYNNWYLLFFLNDCLLSWLGWNSLNEYIEMHGQQNIKFVCLRVGLRVPPLFPQLMWVEM